jgi:hypothetical protein
MDIETTEFEGQESQADSSATDNTAPTTTEQSVVDPTSTSQADDNSDPENQTDPASQSLPFTQGGKEKFKINGKELEWDWPTVQRYAQKGYAGMQALQKAAETEKKARDFFGRLQDSAKRDPEGTLRILLGDPNWRFQAQRQPNGGQGNETHQNDQSQDPRDMKIAELEQKLEKVSGKFEETEIQQERAAIAKELGDAEAKYANLKGDDVAMEFVKSQYRKALAAGIDVTIDDVAFEVNQKLEDRKAQRVNDTKKRIEEKRKTAPVTVTPGAPGRKDKDFESFDDVRNAIKSGKLK